MEVEKKQNQWLKFISVPLCVAIIVAIGFSSPEDFFQQNTHLSGINSDTGWFFNRVFPRKSFEIRGAHLLNPLDIEQLLPLDRSTFWWFTHTDTIERRLRKHALIKNARVSRCSSFSFSCFQIQVYERSPMMVAYVGERPWVIGEEGAFLTPMPRSDVGRAMFQDRSGKSFRPPVVRGLVLPGASPHLSQGRFRFITEAIFMIEAGTKKLIRSIDFRDNGDLVAEFFDLDVRVTFDAADGDLESLRPEVNRLKRLFQELKGKEGELRKIDLAFDRLAVVQLFDEE